MVQNNLEWPILAILQLFQYFPTKVVQMDSEWPIWPFGIIFSHQSALKLFEIAIKVFITYDFHFKCLFSGNITPYRPWGTVLAHLQKYIGGWLRFHYDSSGFNLTGCLPC